MFKSTTIITALALTAHAPILFGPLTCSTNHLCLYVLAPKHIQPVLPLSPKSCNHSPTTLTQHTPNNIATKLVHQATRKLHEQKHSQAGIGTKNVYACLSKKDVGELSALPMLWRTHILPKDNAQVLAKKLRAEQDTLLCGCQLDEKRFRQLIDGEAKTFFTDRIGMYARGLESQIARRQVRGLLHHFDHMFKDAYENIFDTHLNIGDTDALRAWAAFAKAKNAALKVSNMSCTQSTKDLVQCFCHARQVQAMYTTTFRDIAERTGTKYTSAPMKTLFRALEKCAFRAKADTRFLADCICDITRGAIECDTLEQVLTVARAIFDHPDFVVCRLKDRFTNPTSASWRDVMLNGYFKVTIYYWQSRLLFVIGSERVSLWVNIYY